jgi:hypothetical protein
MMPVRIPIRTTTEIALPGELLEGGLIDLHRQ